MASKLIHPERYDNTSAAPMRPSRGDAQATREKILEAARKIIVEEGTDNLTVVRVCELAHVSRGGYLYHFPERTDLIEALAEEYAKHLTQVQNDAMKEATAEGLRDPYLGGYEHWYRHFSSGRIDQGQSPLLSLVVASRSNDKYLAPVHEWYQTHFAALKETPAGADLGLLLAMAYDGLFFHHLFRLKKPEAADMDALLALMHALAEGEVEIVKKETMKTAAKSKGKK